MRAALDGPPRLRAASAAAVAAVARTVNFGMAAVFSRAERVSSQEITSMAGTTLDEEHTPVALSTVGWLVGLVILVAGIVAPASALFFKTFVSRKKADRVN